MGCLEAPQHWLCTLSPPKCYSLWVSALIFKQAQGGAGLLLKPQSVRLTQVPKPPWLISRMLHPRPGCVGQHGTDVDEPAQVWKPDCPAMRFCTSWPALLLTSGREDCKALQLRKTPVLTWAAPRSRIPSASQRGWSVCCVCAVP